jgi:hypothetical protein
LKINRYNGLLSDTLNFILNPFITTGLSNKKMDKQVNVNPTKQFKDVREVMTYLKNNNTGSDEIIANIQRFIEKQPSDLK